MSTETDETRFQEDAPHVELGQHWSSDEAAAEQEAMMADPHRGEVDGTELADGQVVEGEAVLPQAAEDDASPPFIDGSVAAVHSGQSTAAGELYGYEPLIASAAMDDFLSRWNGIQVSFVDDPGTSVENADALTQEVGAALLKSFTDRSSELSTGWREASDTEQLRLALKQYRAFLGVLLPK